jgi:heat shock protein 4
LLFQKFSDEFEKKYGCDPRTAVKPRLRMLDSIEKMRKLLTLNKESEINCESLMEDEDYNR